MGGEKMAKSVGNIRSLPEALAEHGRDALILFFVGGHYRQPIEFDDSTMAQAAASVRRIREAARRLVAGPSPADLAALKERFFAALADDFNTPTALAAVFDWVREANRREPGTGDADLREMLEVLALDNLLDAAGADGEPDDAALALLEQREAARARARLRRGRPPARRAGRAGLGGARLRRRPAARARRSVSAAPSSTGATRPRGAAAGRRPVRRVWATRGAARASRGCATSERASRRARTRSPRARAPRPTRACAPRSAPTPTSTPPSCCARPDPLVVALDEVQDPQNLGAICRTRRVRGRRRRGDPRAALGARSRRRSARPRRARSSTCRSRGCATSPTSSPTPRTPAAGATAPRPRAACPTTSPTTAAGSCSCSAPRAAGCARGWRAACDELVALPLRGPRSSRSTSSAAAAVLLYGILQKRNRRLTALHNCLSILAPANGST